jgi:hypothetical protein
MTDVTPVLSFYQRLKPRSIKAKILLALLALSLLPLILFVASSHPGIVYVRDHVRSELIRDARKDLVQSAKDQATIASAMLDRVEVEMRMAAFFAEALLRNPSAFGRARSESAAEKSDGTLAPGVSMAAAKSALDLSSNLDKVFDAVREVDPSLDQIYYGSQSGVYREYPSHSEKQDYVAFTLEPAFAQYLNKEGEIPEQVWQAFKENGVDISRHAVVSTTQPDYEWLIRDSEKNWIFSVEALGVSDAERRELETRGLGVYWEYDARNDPWYHDAVGRDSVVWTKYSNWSGAQFLFGLKPGIESEITDKVSRTLAQAFEDRQITVIENSAVSIEQGGKWRLQDKTGNRYEIRRENGKLHVYSIDMLSCSRAVLDPEGRLAGVLGLDIGMHSIGRNIIHTPEEMRGYAFVLNERGELIDQEKDDMFIPKAGDGIRSKMAAGDTGIEYAAGSATYVAFAPIRSIRSPDGKSFRRHPAKDGPRARSGNGHHLRCHDHPGRLRGHPDIQGDHRAHSGTRRGREAHRQRRPGLPPGGQYPRRD